MAEPFQKGGVWYARIKNEAGRWRNIALPEAKTKAAARAYAAELALHKRRQRDGLAALPTNPSLTVRALLRWWLDTYVAGRIWAAKEEHRFRMYFERTEIADLPVVALNAGRLDVVFAKRPFGTSKGRLVWREPMVWAAADTFDLIPGAALPLALYRERSVSREAALNALQDGDLTWEIIYTSPSLTGVRAAALAGLAITPLPASAVIAGLRILGAAEGLPQLPDLEFAIYEKTRSDKAAAALILQGALDAERSTGEPAGELVASAPGAGG